MATGDTASRNSRANDFATDYATATLTILAGATTLATHTLAGFGAASNGAITGNAIADATILADGTADSATISSGSGVYTLTVGTSGTDVIINSLTFVTDETSSVSGLAVNFPA